MFDGKKLREMRLELGLTQFQLDNAIGLTQKTICSLELGKHQPSLRKLVKIANYFDVSIDEFINRKEVQNMNSIPQTDQLTSFEVATIEEIKMELFKIVNDYDRIK